jgi:hypothetical protein
MSNSLALEASPVADENAKGRAGLFRRLMEALVASQRRRFEDCDPLLYRFPPL